APGRFAYLARRCRTGIGMADSLRQRGKNRQESPRVYQIQNHLGVGDPRSRRADYVRRSAADEGTPHRTTREIAGMVHVQRRTARSCRTDSRTHQRERPIAEKVGRKKRTACQKRHAPFVTKIKIPIGFFLETERPSGFFCAFLGVRIVRSFFPDRSFWKPILERERKKFTASAHLYAPPFSKVAASFWVSRRG